MTPELSDWSSLWVEQKHDYVLLKVEGDDLDSIDHCLIYNVREHSSLLIEDDDLANNIMRMMQVAGVPVLKEDQLPPGKDALGRLINDMLDSGKSPREINITIKSYQRSRK